MSPPNERPDDACGPARSAGDPGPTRLAFALILGAAAYLLMPDSFKSMWMIYILLAGAATVVGWLIKIVCS